MKKLWISSTAVFLLQLVAGGIALYMTGDWETAFAAAALSAAAVACIAFISISAVELALALSAVASVVALATVSVLPAVLAVVLVVFVAFMDDKYDGFQWTHFICALPLGIGTVLGGALIILGVGRKTEALG